MNELAKITPETMTKLALAGDVASLNPQEKVQYYVSLCQRVGLDASTQPFKLMKLNGKEVFYLDRSGAQQLNRVHQISHEIKSRDFVNGCYVVTARASIGSRFTDSLGSVACEGLKGEAFANATMKAETKAKRRATLDLVGLGMLDEMEVETIPNAVRVEAPAIRQPEQPKVVPTASTGAKKAIVEDDLSFETATPVPKPKYSDRINPEGHTDETPSDLPETIGAVDSVEFKTGKSKKSGKPYTLCTITVNGQAYKTFDEPMAIAAENAKHAKHDVRIIFEERQDGNYTNRNIRLLTVLDADNIP